jgi:ubiquitin-conjugating enzyme E2 W
MLTDPVKELAEIRSKGTPDGIVLLSADNMEEWRFLISVLGEETIYRVSRVVVQIYTQLWRVWRAVTQS